MTNREMKHGELDPHHWELHIDIQDARIIFIAHDRRIYDIYGQIPDVRRHVVTTRNLVIKWRICDVTVSNDILAWSSLWCGSFAPVFMSQFPMKHSPDNEIGLTLVSTIATAGGCTFFCRHSVKKEYRNRTWEIGVDHLPSPTQLTPTPLLNSLVWPTRNDAHALRCLLGDNVKEVFLWYQRELMKLCGADTWKYKIWQCFRKKKYISDRHQRSKEVNFPQNVIYFQKLSGSSETWTARTKSRKALKAHSTGYQSLNVDFELKSVFKVLEVIKGKNSVLCENRFSWINIEGLKLEPLF